MDICAPLCLEGGTHKSLSKTLNKNALLNRPYFHISLSGFHYGLCQLTFAAH